MSKRRAKKKIEDYYFRFRSLDALLGEYKELEKQEIFFSPLEKLNDPMEGRWEAFFEGDEKKWFDFLENYIESFYYNTINILTFGRGKISKSNLEMDFEHLKVMSNNNDILLKLKQEIFSIPELQNVVEVMSKRKLAQEEVRVLLITFHVLLHNNFIKKLSDIDAIKDLRLSANPLEKKQIDIVLTTLNKIANKELEITSEVIERSNIEFLLNQDVDFNDRTLKKRLDINFSFPTYYFEGKIEKILGKIGVSCFMKKNDNSAIWGNYGDEHKGICLKFRRNKEDTIKMKNIKSGEEVEFKFEKVNYRHKDIEFNFFEKQDEKFKGIEVDEIISQKTKHWEYENEYRLKAIFNYNLDEESPQERVFRYEFEELEGIIFGIKTPLEKKIEIIRLIEGKMKNSCKKNFYFYQAKYNNNTKTIDNFLLYTLENGE